MAVPRIVLPDLDRARHYAPFTDACSTRCDISSRYESLRVPQDEGYVFVNYLPFVRVMVVWFGWHEETLHIRLGPGAQERGAWVSGQHRF